MRDFGICFRKRVVDVTKLNVLMIKPMSLDSRFWTQIHASPRETAKRVSKNVIFEEIFFGRYGSLILLMV